MCLLLSGHPQEVMAFSWAATWVRVSQAGARQGARNTLLSLRMLWSRCFYTYGSFIFLSLFSRQRSVSFFKNFLSISCCFHLDELALWVCFVFFFFFCVLVIRTFPSRDAMPAYVQSHASYDVLFVHWMNSGIFVVRNVLWCVDPSTGTETNNDNVKYILLAQSL